MVNTSNKKNVMTALMIAMFLAAIEGTIVSTAMPSIISSLGDVSLLSWVYAVYLLSSAITTPIYGKLSDLFGRKNVFIFGIVVFLVGSMLSGLSQTMGQLIVFRLIQGLGAGAVLPLTYTIVGDLYSFEERAKMQGLFSSIWGVSGIVGPLLGGILVDSLSWRWIFYINLPVGLIALFLISNSLKETLDKKRKHIDYAGAITFTLSMSFLLFAILTGGHQYSWDSLIIMSCLIVGLIFLILFFRVESKSPEPILSLKLFSIRTISISNASGFLSSVILIGLLSYLPLWIQGIYGYGATSSGLTLLPMSIGWPLGSIMGGRLISKVGSRKIAISGMIALLLASIWLAFVTIETPFWIFVLIMLISGFGFGFSITTFTVVVQSVVDVSQRGVATASNMFVRTMGQTLGIAVLGSLFNKYIQQYYLQYVNNTTPFDMKEMNKLLNPELIEKIAPETISSMRYTLSLGLHNVFLVLLGIALVGVLVTLCLPRKLSSTTSEKAREKVNS